MQRIVVWMICAIFVLFCGLHTAWGQNSLPIEVERALSEVNPLVVMITTDSRNPATATYGTGIIIGFDDSYVYVITADHVVWKDETTPRADIKLEVKYPNGDAASIRNVEVTSRHDPPYEEGQRHLDLAVLRFDRRQYKLPLDELNFSVLGRSNDLRAREKMYSIGYADNGTQWNVNPEPELFSRLDTPLLLFGTQSMTAGYSGGPVFNNKFQLVGMIIEHAPPNGSAVTIESIMAKLRTWPEVPNHLKNGPGRIIVDDSDRVNYLLGDAKAAISIFLPMDSPVVRAFADKTKAAVEEYSIQNPRYDNERRELFYISYDEQGGRRVPTLVTILTDSPFWPSYSQDPLMSLLTRIQTTTIHFYKSPIDSGNFNPDSPGSDLSFTFSKNYVKYTSLANQVQAESNYGRLELTQSFYNGTLEQHVWNVSAPKNTWNTNGAIGSLLDLRGGLIIISTVVGNLASREEFRSAFSEVRARTKLNSVNLSLGSRSITFHSSNTRRFIDRNGNPYYVFAVPPGSQQLLEVFK